MARGLWFMYPTKYKRQNIGGCYADIEKQAIIIGNSNATLFVTGGISREYGRILNIFKNPLNM